MSVFPLSLFPDFSLPSSVMATVYVGVWLLCFFNLRFGWPLTGLVVPGFIAPILLVQPHSALFILAEGCVTYVLSQWFIALMARSGAAAPFFGRDRFFLIVLVGVFVRITGDALVMPFWLGFQQGAVPTFAMLANGLFSDSGQQGTFARLGLGSFGLVVSALFANQLWKPGLSRGLLTSLVLLCLTYAFTRLLLVPFTNFNPGRLASLYNEVGSRLADSPKAYIILLCTALLASRLNFLYGWEFNGIMIPSLLALAWFEPLTILVSLAEAGLVLGIAIGLLRLPMFRNTSMEGARKIVFFFTIALVLKLTIIGAFQAFLPHEQPSDFFGFGFLLSTLIAIKAHDKGIFVRMIGTTLQASAAGLVVGLGCSTLLTQLRELSFSRTHEAFASHGDEAAVATPAPGGLTLVPRKNLLTRGDGAPVGRVLPGIDDRDPTAFAALHRVFVEDPRTIAPEASALFRPVDEAWLSTFSEQTLLPFLRALSDLETGASTAAEFRRDMERIARRAEQFCYEIALHPRTRAARAHLTAGLESAGTPRGPVHVASESEGVALLTERQGASCQRHQAAIAVRWSLERQTANTREGESSVDPTVISVPHPLADPLAVEAALYAFERLSARAVVIPLAHPKADSSGRADVVASTGRTSVYRLAQEELLRQFAQGRKEPLRMVEFRATQELSAPVRVSAPFGGEAVLASLSPWSRDARLTYVGAPRESQLVHNRGLEQLAESLGARGMATVWLSRPWRDLFAYRGRGDTLESQQFRSLGISTAHTSLVEYLATHGVAPQPDGVPERLRSLHTGFLRTGEVSQIDAMRRFAGVAQVERVVDERSRMTFIAFCNTAGRVLWIASLGSTAPESVHALGAAREINEANVDAFAFARLGWLEFST